MNEELKCPACGASLKLQDEKELVAVTPVSEDAKLSDQADSESTPNTDTPANVPAEATPTDAA